MADANIQAFVTSKAKAEIDIVRQARLKKLAGPSLTIPTASWRDMTSYFGQWAHLRALLGTMLSWFFLVRRVLILHSSMYACSSQPD